MLTVEGQRGILCLLLPASAAFYYARPPTAVLQCPPMYSPDPLPESSEHRCPACQSEQTTPVGHVTASRGVIKSEHRCEACGTAFWFVRKTLI